MSVQTIPHPRATSPRTTAHRGTPRAGTPARQVSGLLDGTFLRPSGYQHSPDDVRLQPERIKQLGLRPGDHVVATVAGSKLVSVESVNGLTSWHDRPHFADLTPIHPRERMNIETESLTTRVVDLVAPIGKGQRGLIVAPPKAGKTMILQALAQAVSRNHPEIHLMVVLVGERPEEVTDIRKTIAGEVIASTFDHPDKEHTALAELALERAKRLVEQGHDVVMLLDSLTRLGRAYNNLAPSGGRILSGGIDAGAIYPPKRFFGAARNVEGGGSLTILATALVETGSRMDDSFFEEFKGTGNMELRLSRSLAERRLFPAVDLDASSTRREEALMHPAEQQVVWKLRRMLSGLDRQQGMELLIAKLRETSSNAAFLTLAATTTP
ncbi:transcription termination factor Rho [Nonomuraea africana]|uniref:Transcription termination factor Rho n=1 Tax=Nonomuraea africana TaxID=46171 RepID=A0ABR9KRV4_9ACTN|nr:transcription termination factor Rho [Nonomuraea africana]MBE1564760.1 transcription termination factor Rho [Nonomuraea africana]